MSTLRWILLAGPRGLLKCGEALGMNIRSVKTSVALVVQNMGNSSANLRDQSVGLFTEPYPLLLVPRKPVCITPPSVVERPNRSHPVE